MLPCFFSLLLNPAPLKILSTFNYSNYLFNQGLKTCIPSSTPDFLCSEAYTASFVHPNSGCKPIHTKPPPYLCSGLLTTSTGASHPCCRLEAGQRFFTGFVLDPNYSAVRPKYFIWVTCGTELYRRAFAQMNQAWSMTTCVVRFTRQKSQNPFG